jgi:hypothetical protein
MPFIVVIIVLVHALSGRDMSEILLAPLSFRLVRNPSSHFLQHPSLKKDSRQAGMTGISTQESAERFIKLYFNI